MVSAAAICEFGSEVIPAHYAPLIGAEAAAAQVAQWWSRSYIRAAVKSQLITIAELGNDLVGVAQVDPSPAAAVLYKLYVHPDYRGRGIGPRLIAAIVEQLPVEAEHLWVEQLAANTRAAQFYRRQGFVVDHVEPSPTGDPRQAQIWYRRAITPKR